MARTSLFGPKDGGERVQGELSRTGTHLFERARKELAKLAKIEWSRVSDSDVIEYLARDRKME